MSEKNYRLEPFPRGRRFAIDAGRLGRGRHIIHGLLEIDVTTARERLRAIQQQTGEKLSFTAFIIYCLGQAIGRHDHVHAYLNWRKQLVIYDDVNINTMIEADLDGRKVPVPHILKSVNRRFVQDLSAEIRSVQANPGVSREVGFMRWFLAFPWVLRRFFYWVVTRVPQSFRENSSSVLVTAVGMFGHGSGWGIPMANFTLTVTLGGISEKPAVVAGQVVPREMLDLTISIDHDVVDGAPAARFVSDFRQLIESGYGLPEP